MIDEINKKELLQRLRDTLRLDETCVTDSQMLKATEGSFLRAKIELSMAFDKFKPDLALIIFGTEESE